MVNKDKRVIFIKFTISFGLLSILLWIVRHNIADIVAILKNSNKLFFMLALSINIPLSVGVSFRLKLLMLGQKINLSLKNAVYLTFIGHFFNNFFPTAIGGDIVKAHYASKKTNKAAASYAAVLVDRLFGALSCLSMAIIGIIFVGKDLKNNKIIWAVAAMLGLLVLLIFVLLNKKRMDLLLLGFAKTGFLNKIRNKISKLYNAVNFYKHSKGLLLKTYLLAVFMQGAIIFCIYFFVLCVGGDIHLLKLFFIVPLIWAVSMLPSLNGLGVRETAFVYFLKGDIGIDMAFSVSVLWLGVIILYSIIGGVIHLVCPLRPEVKAD